MYKCRNPFNTKIGQFEYGKHTLVVGVAEAAAFAGKEGDFTMTIGTNPKVYTMPYKKLQTIEHHVWKNPRGLKVWIIPVKYFGFIEVKAIPKLLTEKKKPEPKVVKRKKKEYQYGLIDYCLLGKREGTTVILGYSRNLNELIDKFRKAGWKDSELTHTSI